MCYMFSDFDDDELLATDDDDDYADPLAAAAIIMMAWEWLQLPDFKRRKSVACRC